MTRSTRAKGPHAGKPSNRRRQADSAGPPTRHNILWRWRRVLFLFWLLIFFGIAGALFLLSRVPLPAANAQFLAQTTFIYDANGHQLAAFDPVQNRSTVSLNEVPQIVVDAALSTEDRNFYHHGAIDPLGVMRAGFSDLRGRGNLQGASTITQQYVKTVYTGSERTVMRKLKEAALAVKLERELSKRQVLERYLNTIYLGRGAYGIQAASHAYFNEDVSKIGLQEAAYLAGAIRSPETDDPYTGTTANATATSRRLLTLRALVRDHKISQADLERVNNTPVRSYVQRPAATKLNVRDTSFGTQYFVDYIHSQLLKRFPSSVVQSGGLRVYTTLDPAVQQKAWTAVYGEPNGLKPGSVPPEPAGALVAVDDHGQVKAMVGGEDYGRSQVNLAVGKEGGGTGRQAGSTFKPFLLAETVKEGYSVQSTFPGPPKIVVKGGDNGHDYTVNNFQNEDAGPAVSLIDATANSVNTVYAQLQMAIGPPKLVKMATQMGIDGSELAPNASLVLGSSEVSVLEMAGAYSTFADGGTHISPQVITKVTTSNGSPLPWPAPTATAVLTRAQNATVTYCLQQVVQRGTGTAAAVYRQSIAGKTGTTNDYGDAWFVGYTPHLTAAVWMGYPEGSQHKLTDVRGIRPGVQGGSLPAQIFNRFMTAAITANPALIGSFDSVTTLSGNTITAPTGITYPLGTGSTTTSSSSSTTTSTTRATTTTTGPATSSTTKPTGTTVETTPPSRTTTTTVATTTTTKPPPPAPQGALPP
jgi:penicillin-binding protein 1A